MSASDFISYEMTNDEYNYEAFLDSAKSSNFCPFYANNAVLAESAVIVATYDSVTDLFSDDSLLKRVDVKTKHIIFDDSNQLDAAIEKCNSVNYPQSFFKNALSQMALLKEQFKEEGTFDQTNKTQSEHSEISGCVEELPIKINGQIKHHKHFLALTGNLLNFFNKRVMTTDLWQAKSVDFLEALMLKENLDFASLSQYYYRFLILIWEAELQDRIEDVFYIAEFFKFLFRIAKATKHQFFNYISDGQENVLELTYLDGMAIEKMFFSRLGDFNVVSSGISYPFVHSMLHTYFKADKLERLMDDSEDRNLKVVQVSTTNNRNTTYYGQIIIKLSKSVPDGILVLFSSYALMEFFVDIFRTQGVFDKILETKLVFFEEKFGLYKESLFDFEKAIEVGIGGIYFGVIGSAVNLGGKHANAVVFVGFPLEKKEDRKEDVRKEYLLKNYKIEPDAFIKHRALNLINRRVGEIFESSEEKKVICFLDCTVNFKEIQQNLPFWLKQHIEQESFSKLNTDEQLKELESFFE